MVKNSKKQERERTILKTAKGTRDYAFRDQLLRQKIARKVEDCFKKFGGSPLSTPSFELKDILTNKYGEDSKLIFELQDQGGEELALRYDLTVPLARYLAMNGGNVAQSQVYQIAPVYRRDNPVMSRGRMREFMQADFDYIGTWDPLIPESQIISLACTILQTLNIGKFTIKVNNRKILDGIFEICGVPLDKIRAISSAVDKLDKMPWVDVKKEMVEEKGLDEGVADLIGGYVVRRPGSGGAEELLDELFGDAKLVSNESAKEGLDEMRTLFERLTNAARVPLDKITFDLSLARGLDYYTGVIYEAVVLPDPSDAAISESGATSDPVNVGSIAAGGRYDYLVENLSLSASQSSKKNNTPSVPCCGISIGLDRIFTLTYQKSQSQSQSQSQLKLRDTETMIYVMNAKDSLLNERGDIVAELRASGIPADFMAKRNPKLKVQFAEAKRMEVPFVVIIGTDEVRDGRVRVKRQLVPKENENENEEGKEKTSENKGVLMPRSDLVRWVKSTEEWKNSYWCRVDDSPEKVEVEESLWDDVRVRYFVGVLCFVSLVLNGYFYLSRT